MKNPDLQTNASLRRFLNMANKKYFGGRLTVDKIEFSPKLGNQCHGKSGVRVFADFADQHVEVEVHFILINSRLRRWHDLCMMTVYHEMVHVELDMLGLRGKELSCGKSGTRFNQRMAELAQAGAFNGLW